MYSANNAPQMNKDFVDAYKKGLRPAAGLHGSEASMHLIYEALKKTGGKDDGNSLIAAMKGMAWESPRGPISIRSRDPRHGAEHLHPQGPGEKQRELCTTSSWENLKDIKEPGKTKK